MPEMNSAPERTPERKRDCDALVLSNSRVAPGFFRMVVSLENADSIFRPGQFFQLRIDPKSLDPLLRRPFAPSETFPDTMAFVYAVVGHGTRVMSELHEGDRVSVLCPLGNCFALPEEKNAQALLVGGGCGAPSLLTLARALGSAGHAVHVALGARTQCSLLEVEAMAALAARLEVATDDGSHGIRGHAISAAETILSDLDPDLPVRIYACGPDPMLRALSALAEDRGIPCQVSLEARMACGFGACVGCVVKVRDATRPEGFAFRKVCCDGPVFDSREIVWE
jgi:dihydroorotate dehydrogenase electron transfer subunit